MRRCVGHWTSRISRTSANASVRTTFYRRGVQLDVVRSQSSSWMENRSATRQQLLRRWSSGTPNPRCTQRMRHRFAVRSSWRTILTRCWGPSVRAAIVTPLFHEDPDLALRVLMTGMPDGASRNLRRLGRIFPAYYRFRHKIKAQRLQQDRADVADALDRISRELQPSGYLVGEAF